MNKKILIMMALLIGSLSAHADFVSREEAEAKAQNFISQNMMRSSSDKHKAVAIKKELVCVSSDEMPAYYIFNYADSTGFVIVSAESNTIEILAYSDRDYFHEEDIDKGAEVFLEQYKRDAAIARANALTAKQREYVNNATKAASSTEVLLETASLNQYDGYWREKFAPLNGVPAGCVATAAAIIMHYHQWPAQGKGSNSYVSLTHNLSLSRDFSQDTYNWSCIPKTPYYLGTWSEEAKNEAPKILLACGIASNMDYDYNGSGASTTVMVNAMVKNFSYSIGYKNYDYYNSNTDMSEAWQAARNNIDNNMPVLVSGGGDRGGHAFVLDGYNNQYYHYNLGWGGSNSGWWSNGSISYDNYSLYNFYTGISPQTGKTLFEGTTPEGLSYKIDDAGLLRISGKGEITESISDTLKNITIIECIIEDGVTAIKNYSLYNLNLSKLTIPSTVKEIESYALRYGINEIIVAESNPVFSSPGNYCLYNKETKTLLNYSSNESEIHFPEGVEKLGANLFACNYTIKEIDVPEGVTYIGSSAFSNANSLQKVTLPSTLTSLYGYAFAYSGIKTLICKSMYPSLKGTYNFYKTSVDTDGTLYVPYEALDRYAAEPEFKVWHEIKAIPGSESWKNTSKAQVTVTNAGTLEASIGTDASKVRELIVTGPINGTDLKFIRGLCSNDNANRMLSIIDLSKARIVAGGESYYQNNKVEEDDVIPTYAFYSCDIEKLMIPETTKKICYRVLPNSLKTINLPEGLKTIESYAFFNLFGLKSLHIPASVEKIYHSMSAASWSLTELDVDKDNKYYKSEGNIIYTIDGKTIVASAILSDEVLNIPEGVENIFFDTFYGCDFKKLCLPSTLKTIAYYAFANTNLDEVTCLATVPPQAENAFRNNNVSSCILYVPAASVSSYKQADMWSSFSQIKDMVTSDIDETVKSPLHESNGAVYDLSGRRISNTESLQPGIYIIKGRKVKI